MQKIPLESVRLDAVMNICNVSESVFDANRLAGTGMTATYVPEAAVVVFKRPSEPVKPQVVPMSRVHTMTPVELDIDQWDRKGRPKPDKPEHPEHPDTPVAPPHDGLPPGHGGTPPGQDKEKPEHPDKPDKPDKPPKRGPGRPPKDWGRKK
jgi:hypothetical protein